MTSFFTLLFVHRIGLGGKFVNRKGETIKTFEYFIDAVRYAEKNMDKID